MTVAARNPGPDSRGANMGKKQPAFDLFRDAFQVLVIPRWQDIAEQPRFGF